MADKPTVGRIVHVEARSFRTGARQCMAAIVAEVDEDGRIYVHQFPGPSHGGEFPQAHLSEHQPDGTTKWPAPHTWHWPERA